MSESKLLGRAPLRMKWVYEVVMVMGGCMYVCYQVMV